MKETFLLLDEIPRDTKIILFLLGPHWIKVPPLSLAYLENFLNSRGFTTAIVDLNMTLFHLLGPSKNEWLALNSPFENTILSETKRRFPLFFEHLVQHVASSKAQMIGFSLFSRNRKATFEFANEIADSAPTKTFVFGGPEVLFEYYRDCFFDELKTTNAYFVLGEGEQTLLDICQSVYRQLPMDFIRFKEKQLIQYKEIADLDSLPYLDFGSQSLKCHPSATLPLFSSRGCIKRCLFCSECKLYTGFRQHSPEYMLSLIKRLIRKYGKRSFCFHDSLINANLDWLEKLCKLLIQENLHIQWEAQLAIRPGMTTRLFDAMKKAGCYNLFIGLESASDRVLTLMQKGYESALAKRLFEELSGSGIHFEISIIAGFPQETEEDFQETLKFLRDNKHHIPKIAQVNPFVEYSPARIRCRNPHQHQVARQRTEQLIEFMKKENIKHTRSFINNLITV